jgi:hypothetical protein
MVARYWGKIAGDHEYNRVRRQFGDTTDPKAQILALKTLGLRATFEMEGTAALLENEIRSGFPTPVGWLHKGPSTGPTGSGHWTVVSGFTPTTSSTKTQTVKQTWQTVATLTTKVAPTSHTPEATGYAAG